MPSGLSACSAKNPNESQDPRFPSITFKFIDMMSVLHRSSFIPSFIVSIDRGEQLSKVAVPLLSGTYGIDVPCWFSCRSQSLSI